MRARTLYNRGKHGLQRLSILNSYSAISGSNIIIRSLSFDTKAGVGFVHFRKINDDLIPINKSRENTGGNTRLHHLVIAGANIKEVEEFIATQHEKDVADMAKTVNDDGYLPIDYVAIDNEKTLLRLSELTLDHANDNKVIDFESLTRKYQLSEQDKLFRGLCVASTVVNCIYQLNIESSTMPNINGKDGAISRASSRLNTLRKTFGRFIRFTESLPEDYDRIKNVFVDIEAYFVTKFNVGNCHEFSYLALSQLRELDDSHQAEIFLMSNGNHVFTVLNRDPDSDPNDYRTWGKDAVVLDAHTNDTFPAYDIPNRLKANERHETYMMRRASRGAIPDFSTFKRHNVATTFNPNYHRLKPLLRIKANEADESKSNYRHA